MIVRNAAAAILALTGVTLAAPAQAAPGCTVTVMGLTFDQCRPDATAGARAGAPAAWTRGTAPADLDVATGGTARAPVRR